MRLGRILQTLIKIWLPTRLFNYCITCRKRLLIWTIFFKIIFFKLNDNLERTHSTLFSLLSGSHCTQTVYFYCLDILIFETIGLSIPSVLQLYLDLIIVLQLDLDLHSAAHQTDIQSRINFTHLQFFALCTLIFQTFKFLHFSQIII